MCLSIKLNGNVNFQTPAFALLETFVCSSPKLSILRDFAEGCIALFRKSSYQAGMNQLICIAGCLTGLYKVIA